MTLSENEKDRLFKSIDDIHHILTGNGNPEEGLVYMTRKNTDFRLFWERFGWLVLAAFAGVPCTVVAGIVLHIAKGG